MGGAWGVVTWVVQDVQTCATPNDSRIMVPNTTSKGLVFLSSE
jgi:hypothetical protein